MCVDKFSQVYRMSFFGRLAPTYMTLNGGLVSGLGMPGADTDATNKLYVDNLINQVKNANENIQATLTQVTDYIKAVDDALYIEGAVLPTPVPSPSN
jgi:hypothetical protein